MLGEGRFSQVYSATRGKSLNVALKVVEMATLEEDEDLFADFEACDWDGCF